MFSPEDLVRFDVGIVRQKQTSLVREGGNRWLFGVVVEKTIHFRVHGQAGACIMKEVVHDLSSRWRGVDTEKLEQFCAGILNFALNVQEKSLRLKEVVLENGV